MSEQAQFVAAAAAAAAALVAEMTKDGWAAARDVVARAFRRGGEQMEEQQLARLDADQREAQTTERSVLLDRWQRRLLTLVEDYPEALLKLPRDLGHVRVTPRGSGLVGSAGVSRGA
ncbi:hypothetical protein ABT126_45730 [Streptomyces sp. NPDC002012]|uniref:hypothetical protein n=1 Tax=Streptomyces sp. NPDC002012 TaxID=3154532 RepID=UPI00331DC209